MSWAPTLLEYVGPQRSSRAANDAVDYYSRSTGRLFDRIAAESPPDRFTAADLYALTTLSAPLDAEAGARLLDSAAKECCQFLREIPTDCAIRDSRAARVLADGESAAELYEFLRAHDGIGPTRASKLLAVKRPALVPIRDSFVELALNASREPRWWVPMAEAWANPRVSAAVEAVRALANARDLRVPAYVTDLRLLDVVLWRSVASRRLTAVAPSARME